MWPVALIGTGLVAFLVAAVLQRRGERRSAVPVGPGGSAPRSVPSGGRGGLVGLLADHRWARRSLGVVAVVMVLAAAGVAAFPFITDTYTETVQKRLETQLVKGSTKTAYLAGTIEVGDSLTRIQIPKLGLDTIVVEGTTTSALRAGAGHFPETPLPCEPGNVAIAGHRTTYGKPFTDLEKLTVGDEITLETPVGSCRYRVKKAPFEVAPGDIWVADADQPAGLTLTTCHPEGSARQRLVVQADIIDDEGSTP